MDGLHTLWQKLKALVLDPSLVRFLLVGIANTIVGTGIMFLLYNCVPWPFPPESAVPYWISSGANYIIGSILSFFLNKYFTFQAKEWSWAQVGRFIFNIAVCYFLAYGIAKPLVRLAFSGAAHTVQDNAAMLCGMVFFTAFNYFGQRFFAFKK